jgi:hypothetical protein
MPNEVRHIARDSRDQEASAFIDLGRPVWVDSYNERPLIARFAVRPLLAERAR